MEIKHINRAALAIAERHDIDILEAKNIMNSSSLWIIADNSLLHSYSKQLSLITAVIIAHRVFLGGVFCIIPDNVPNLLRFQSIYLKDLITKYGGTLMNEIPLKNTDVKILFGIECFDDNCIETVSDGWKGGVNFYNQKRILFPEKSNYNTLGPIAAASLACYYAFCKNYRLIDNEIEMNSGISLWNLNMGMNWYEEENDGPDIINLPKNIWILGLGHLGQAYLWTLGLMPFSEPNKTNFLLQDGDIVEEENIGSQVLSSYKNIGTPKTRACLEFLESFKFKTQIIEKPFIQGDSEQDWMRDFPILLNGVDNAQTRRGINKNLLKLFIDGATNGSLDLFDSFTMKNVTMINREPNILWPQEEQNNKILHKNLYDKYLKSDGCGVITNYGISTPFVGLFGSTIVVSELLRSLNQGNIYSIVSLQMRDLFGSSIVNEGTYNKELLRFII